MRLFFLTLACLAIAVSVTAQKNFEGTIRYSVRENGRDEAMLNVEFGPNAIRASFEEKDGMSEKELFILLDSLLVADVSHGSKSYRTSYHKKAVFDAATPVMIGGYKTKPVTMTSRPSMLSYFAGASFFVSEDLVFHVPDEIAGIDELMMVNNNRIVLGFAMGKEGATTQVTDFESAFRNNEFQGVIIMATSIITRKQDPKLFVIPADYTRMSREELEEAAMAYADSTSVSDEMYATDSAMAMDPTEIKIDSAFEVKVPPPPPPKKKQPAKKAPVKKTKPVAAARKLE